MNSRDKVTRNRSPPSTPSTQNLGVNVASSLHSSMPNLETQINRTNKNNLSYNIIMNKNNLSQLTKNQLIELLLAKKNRFQCREPRKLLQFLFHENQSNKWFRIMRIQSSNHHNNLLINPKLHQD